MRAAACSRRGSTASRTSAASCRASRRGCATPSAPRPSTTFTSTRRRRSAISAPPERPGRNACPIPNCIPISSGCRTSIRAPTAAPTSLAPLAIAAPSVARVTRVQTCALPICLFQARLDGEQDIGGFLSSFKAGLRYAKRTATFYNVHINTPTPFGNIGTGSEARAKRVSDTELYPDFIGLSDIHPRIYGGAHFVGPNGDFMLSDDGLDRRSEEHTS